MVFLNNYANYTEVVKDPERRSIWNDILETFKKISSR